MSAGRRPTVRSVRLGEALSRHRVAAGKDQAEAAAAIMASKTKVSRMEAGKVTVRPLDVSVLLDLYGVESPEERSRLLQMAARSGERAWWLDIEAVNRGYASLMSLENEATYISFWDPILVPGLLQTQEYTEAIIAAGPVKLTREEMAELADVRRRRQERMMRDKVKVSAIVWEPAIAASLGGPSVHARQVDHLLSLCATDFVTVQVLPHGSSAVAGMSSHFTAFSFGANPAFEAVTIEGMTTTQVIEATDDLISYSNLYDALRSEALSPDESADLIRASKGSNKEAAS